MIRGNKPRRTGDAGGLPEGATGGVGAGATLVFFPVVGVEGSSSPVRLFLLFDGSAFLGGRKGVGDDVPVLLLLLFVGVGG